MPTTHRHAALVVGAALAAGLWMAGPAALAAGLDQPEGEIILTVSGAIEATNDADTAVFDLAMLEQIDPVSFSTTTIWTDGVQEFSGASLAGLLETLGVEGGTLRATAINDYAVEIPVSDAIEGGPIVAYRTNGEEMSIRDKGPLWIVYPYDSSSDYQTEQVYSRSIWQLDRIEVID